MDPNSEITRHVASTDSSKAPAEFDSGQIIANRYEVIAPLGHGGMGVVYRVRNLATRAEYALKTIDRQRLTDITIRRFEQEARATFAVEHPNIVKVIEFGILDDQSPFLVMEIVIGENLSERIRKKRLSVEEACNIFVQVCFGLAYAHQRGIVHRDIKPSNIMLVDGAGLGKEGSVKILDFGIAKIAGHEGGEMQALTKTGEIFGSPLYMSPEQCTGGKVDQRSDVYSLGCVLFEALTGTPPFVGENALSTMMLHQSQTSPSLKEASLGDDFPPELETIAARMIAKSPVDRYQDLGEAALDLSLLGQDKSTQTASTADGAQKQTTKKNSTSEKKIAFSKKSFWAILSSVALVSVGAGVLGAKVFHLSDDQKKFVAREDSSPLASVKPNDEYKQFSDDVTLLKDLANPDVEFIKMRGYLIQRRLMGYVGEHKKLKDLDFNQSKFEPTNSFEFLTNCKSLESIQVKQTNFDDLSAVAVSHIKSLKSLHIEGTNVTDAGIEELAKLPHLHTLAISGDNYGARAMRAISKMPELESFDLACTISADDFRKLRNPNTRFLRLGYTNLSDEGFVDFGAFKSLETLHIKQAAITAAGMELILQSSKNLRILGLTQCNHLSDADTKKLKAKYPQVAILNKTR